jgi:hypothetical protein
MPNVLSILTCVAALSASSPAGATDLPRLNLRDGSVTKIGVMALGAPAWFLLGTVMHESSHVAMAAAADIGIDSFRPYPQHIGFADGTRAFVLGKVDYATAQTISVNQWALVSSAPFLTDATVFATTDLVLSLSKTTGSWSEALALTLGMVVPLVDYANGINQVGKPYSDAAMINGRLGLKSWEFMAIGHALTAVGIWRVVHHGLRIFGTDSKDSAAAKGDWSLVPVMTPRYGGLSLARSF